MVHNTFKFAPSLCTCRQCSDMLLVPILLSEIPLNATLRKQEVKNTDFSYASGKNTKIVVRTMTCVRKEMIIPS